MLILVLICIDFKGDKPPWSNFLPSPSKVNLYSSQSIAYALDHIGSIVLPRYRPRGFACRWKSDHITIQPFLPYFCTRAPPLDCIHQFDRLMIGTLWSPRENVRWSRIWVLFPTFDPCSPRHFSKRPTIRTTHPFHHFPNPPPPYSHSPHNIPPTNFIHFVLTLIRHHTTTTQPPITQPLHHPQIISSIIIQIYLNQP